MNNANYGFSEDRDIELDFVDIFWKLLIQWKAILFVCLITALLVSSFKYIKDRHEYNAFNETHRTDSDISLDDFIVDTLSHLSEDEKADVLFVMHQENLLKQQRAYLDNSILLNTNPSHQRQIRLKYLVKDNIDMDASTIVEEYSAFIRRKDVISSLGEIIAPGTDLDYISELVSTSADKNPPESDPVSNILTITIVLPDDIDGDQVSETIDSYINCAYPEVKASSGEHILQKIDTEEVRLYSSDTANTQNAIIERISNLKSSKATAEKALSDEGKAALAAIRTYKSSRNLGEPAIVVAKPVISKVYALLGFLIGLFLYVGFYMIRLIMKKSLASASNVCYITHTRLIGEMYRLRNHRGFSKLLSSNAVSKLRYKDHLDVYSQVKALSSTIDAITSYHEMTTLSFLKVGIGEGFDDIVEKIVSECKSIEHSIALNILDAESIDEKAFSRIDSIVYIVTSATNIDQLNNLNRLCKDYNVTNLGTIYMEAL